MMKHEKTKLLSEEVFRRLTGVKRSTFELMVEKVSLADARKKAKGGRANKLSIEDRVLMTLEYLREYRTYLHISQSYGMSESVCFKTIRFIENTLMDCKEFALPGRRALLKSDMVYETILIDATETPIERPQKNNGVSTRERKSGIH